MEANHELGFRDPHRPRRSTACFQCGESVRVVDEDIYEPAAANYGHEMVARLRAPNLRQSQAAVGQILGAFSSTQALPCSGPGQRVSLFGQRDETAS